MWAKRSPMPESVGGWRWQRCRVKVDGTKWNGMLAKNAESGDAQCNFDAFRPHLQAQWADCPGCPKCEKTGGYVLRRGSGRCTTAHEYIFLFAKTNRYFWDGEASKEKAIGGTPGNKTAGKNHEGYEAGELDHRYCGLWRTAAVTERNPRSVWTLSSEPTSVRHFATYPSELVRRCLASSPAAGGVCAECGAPFAPVVEPTPETKAAQEAARNGQDWYARGYDNTQKMGRNKGGVKAESGYCSVNIVHGYRPTCGCNVMDYACQSCGFVLEYKHEQDQTTDLQAVRHTLRTDQGKAAVLLPQVLLPVGAKIARQELRALRTTVSSEGISGQVLQQDMRLSLECYSQEKLQGEDDNNKGVCSCENEGPSQCFRRLCNGAQAGNGKATGEAASEHGGSASQEWDKDRQQTGQSSCDGQKATRLIPQAYVYCDLSSLPASIQYERACPCCGKTLTNKPSRGLPTILDCFSGTGTTGQTARHLGCKYIGIDLNPEYQEYAKVRIFEPPRWWLRQQAKAGRVVKVRREPMTLFGGATC